MAEFPQLNDPWLVAVWPGMGNVALQAGGHLINQLRANLAVELPARDLFEIQHIDVKDGVATVGRLPRNMLFGWKDPRGKQDLLIFIGEAQPPTGGYHLCHRLLEEAEKVGVRRLVTFAAMATQLHPSNTPRVFGAGSREDVLEDLQPHGVELLEEGQISGLNGVLLGAGMERDIPGLCLLGELPFFAVGVPNPRASQAVLEVFASLTGVEVDVSELARQSEVVEKQLLQLMERLSEQGEGEGEEEFTIPGVAEPEEEEEEPTEKPRKKEEPQLDLAARQRIEELFQNAGRDRSKAMELKRELDRLGVFNQYEDRFLDLFKKAD